MKNAYRLLSVVAVCLAVCSAFGQGMASPAVRGRLPNRTLTSPTSSANAKAAAAASSVMTEADLEKVPVGTNGVPALAFDQCPIELVLQTYGRQIKKTILPEPTVDMKKTITLKSLEDQEFTEEEYLEAIEIVLTMNGVVLEPLGEKFLKALPRKTLRTTGVPLNTSMTTNALPEKGHVVSQMIALRNITANEIEAVVKGFMDPNGLLQKIGDYTLIVTDTQENINRILELLGVVDVKRPSEDEVEVIPIRYAKATDIQKALEDIVKGVQSDNKAAAGTKSSGAPGFAKTTTAPAGRLLGRPTPQTPAATANETQSAELSEANRGVITGKVFMYADDRSGNLIIITRPANIAFFKTIIASLDVKTDPRDEVCVHRLKYADAKDVEDMLNKFIGNASSQNKNGNANAGAQPSVAKNLTTGARQQTGSTVTADDANIGDMNKDNTTILADERINGIVIRTRTAFMPKIIEIIEQMDIKLAQVLIETAIIEVQLGDTLTTGIDWVRGGKNNIDPAIRGGNYALGGGGGSGSGTLKTLAGITESSSSSSSSSSSGYATVSASDVAGAFANPVGSGINYLISSESLNISAVISASKTDSRSKYLASPIIMTVDNKEATIDATQSRQFLTGYQTSSSYYGSDPAPQYSEKEIGIKIKVKPKINPNGTVMLNIEEEYSQLGAKQTILDPDSEDVQIDTSLSRKMTADVLLTNMQTVVLGGLTETKTSSDETGIPILKDIPWIGRWMFGSVKDEESRKELLVFMTPYILPEGDEAQEEAARRKDALSDDRAWTDRGWSKSALADPVTAKERIRRAKEKWANEDKDHAGEKEYEEALKKRAEELLERADRERAERERAQRDRINRQPPGR